MALDDDVDEYYSDEDEYSDEDDFEEADKELQILGSGSNDRLDIMVEGDECDYVAQVTKYNLWCSVATYVRSIMADEKPGEYFMDLVNDFKPKKVYGNLWREQYVDMIIGEYRKHLDWLEPNRMIFSYMACVEDLLINGAWNVEWVNLDGKKL